KVLTLNDPRKPLPEAVNVQFQFGEICRILVSSPWMPPICSFCKEVGHCLKRCKTAPVTCSVCNCVCHLSLECPRALAKKTKKVYRVKSKESKEGNVKFAAPITGGAVRSLPSSKGKGKVSDPPSVVLCSTATAISSPKSQSHEASQSQWIQVKPRSNSKKDKGLVAPSSHQVQNVLCLDIVLEQIQELEKQNDEKCLSSDSSDVSSADGEVDPNYDDAQFFKMFSQRQHRHARGKGPKTL
ncbi:unnamed protein product, partial [Arabidopsis halleri]